MKKLFIAASLIIGMIAGVMVLSSFSEPKELLYSDSTVSTNTVFLSDPMCVLVGNCSVTIGNNGAYGNYAVFFTNYNNYRVTVNYEVYGYDAQGNRRKVVGGVASVAASNGDKYGKAEDSFSTSCTDLALENVSVYKCE